MPAIKASRPWMREEIVEVIADQRISYALLTGLPFMSWKPRAGRGWWRCRAVC